jgi:hypothetical protein
VSILNRPSDGLVSVLVALARSSVMLGTMSRSKLLDLCSPKSLGDGKQDMATKTLNRWIELGLFTLSDKDVKVSDGYRSKLRKTNATVGSIAEVVREIVLSPANNENFWNDEENRAADFSRAACWMLSQDVHQFVPTSYSQVEPKALEQVDSAEVILFQNDTRWSGFVSWATFLGFGRSESGKASGGFVADPTPAIVNHVSQLVPKKGDIAINDFIDGLVQSVPVLDGGEYRREVEGKLKPEKWKSPGPTELSTSLSRALLRLRAMGTIRLEKRSDSDAQMKLIGRDRDVVQSVTHVLRGDAK